MIPTTVSVLVIVSALVTCILSVANPPRIPLWVSVLLVIVFCMLQVLPK